SGGSPDLAGDPSSSGYNLIGNPQARSGFADTDLLNLDPRLGPLQDNGGPTQTMALLPGSPALNAGDPAQLGVADQRGVARGGGVNIGAYQASASALPLTGLPASAAAGTSLRLAVAARATFAPAVIGDHGTARCPSSDGGASLPADYPSTAADGGVRAFTGLVLRTRGSQSITVTDTGTAALTVTGTVNVARYSSDTALTSSSETSTYG